MIVYFYTCEGGASDGQTWETDGTVEAAGRGDFMKAVEEAMRRSFMKLTTGDAIFGRPGVGCSGPYHITKFTISERDAQEN